MAGTRLNALDQALDIAGSSFQSSSSTLADEAAGLGAPLSGQAGSIASLTSLTETGITVIGLTGMTAQSIDNFLQITGASSAENNGIFYIDAFISSSSVTIINPVAVAFDANHGIISWTERNPYSLQDDLNYERTDRAAIKGVAYSAALPTYQRPTTVGTNVSANLLNIAGKTTDAAAYNVNRVFFDQSVVSTNTFITISSTDNLKHADVVNHTGIPCFDVAPFIGDWISCYTHIVDGFTDGYAGNQLTVIDGVHAGERIFGITYNGASTSPDSVEVRFYSAPYNANYVTSATPYTWESNQPTKINVLYGYVERLDQLDINAFRSIPALGVLTGTALANNLQNASETSFDFTDTSFINHNNVQKAIEDLDFAISSGSGGSGSVDGLIPAEHEKLRQLIHLADGVGGPFEGFSTNAYREITPSNSFFPTSIIWWMNLLKTKKYVEKNISYNGNKTPSILVWKVYDTDGSTVLATVTDTIVYSGIFELNRTRGIVSSVPTSIALTKENHKYVRQLIHLADGIGGPFEGFNTNVYREITPSHNPLPTSIIWYEDATKAKKIVEKSIIYNINKTVSSVSWQVYDTDGSTVLATVTDVLMYSGIFENNRTRSII